MESGEGADDGKQQVSCHAGGDTTAPCDAHRRHMGRQTEEWIGAGRTGQAIAQECQFAPAKGIVVSPRVVVPETLIQTEQRDYRRMGSNVKDPPRSGRSGNERIAAKPDFLQLSC